MDSNEPIKCEIDASIAEYEDVKVEVFPMQIKQEIGESVDVSDSLMDSEVEGHSIKVEPKEEFEHESNQSFVDTSHKTSCESHKPPSKIYHCQFCQYSTIIKLNFESHLQSHINSKIQENLRYAELLQVEDKKEVGPISPLIPFVSTYEQR